MINIDIRQIMSILPHRYPFLLVDRISEIDLINKSIVGIKNVSANEPQFTGHFPSEPVMPGVLIIEAMAQTAAILVAKSMESMDEKEVLFLSIEKAKFRKLVQPGDILVMRVNLIQNKGAVWKFRATSKVNNKIVSEGVFTAMIQNKTK